MPELDDSNDIRTWNERWDSASQAEQAWRADGERIIQRYRDEGSRSRKNARFNILWSNNEILLPALYLKTPEPDVRRRYRDKDPVAKAVAEVIERSLSFILDDQDPDFDTIIYNVLQDYTLPGRGSCRARYEPEFGEEREDLILTNPEEEDPDLLEATTRGGEIVSDFQQDQNGAFRMNTVLLDEKVVFEYSYWKDIRFGRFKTWPPPWAGFEGGMTRNEIKENFPELTDAEIDLIPFDRNKAKDQQKVVNATNTRNDNSAPPEATVREIWDKDDGQYIIYAPDMKTGADTNAKILHRGAPPLELKKFFDMPEPLYAVKTTDTGIPVPEYRMYQDQAMSLDTVTNRIDELVDAMKVRGVYDKQFKELANLFRQGNKKLVPVDNYQKLIQSGGLNGGALQMVDISIFANAVGSLYTERDQLKNIIFEVIGLADIMRGVSNPEEALGTQRLKANFGSNRLERRQKAVQRFIRDILRIASEIVCEVFELETIQRMTGLDYPTRDEKQQAAQLLEQLQQAQQVVQTTQAVAQSPQGQQASQTPEGQQIAQQVAPTVQQAQQFIQQNAPAAEQAQEIIKKPAWEDIYEVMQNEATRKFRIDIETDSTIAMDDQREKQVMAEMLGAMAQILQVLGQAEMQGILTREQTNAFLLSVIRKLDGGRAVEDIFDQNDETNKESLLIQQMREQMDQMGQALQDRTQEFQLDAAKIQGDIQTKTQSNEIDQLKAMLQSTTQEEVANIKKASSESVALIKAATDEATANTNQTTELLKKLADSIDSEKERAADENSRRQEQILNTLTTMVAKSQGPRTVTRTEDGFSVE